RIGDRIGRCPVVVGKRGCLADADQSVAVLECEDEELALTDRAPGCVQRGPEPGPHRPHRDLHRLSSRPAESSAQNTSWSMPVWARAWLSEGPSTRVRTVRTTRAASGTVSQGSRTHAVSGPKSQVTGTSA